MIYFDNAATTYKKPHSVIRAVEKCIKKYSANPGRGAHRLSVSASELVYDARECIARFFGIDAPERVVFTYNTTYALNIAIKTLINPSSHVIISNLEHNSVLRPIHKLKETIGVEYGVFNAMADDLYAEIVSHIRPDTQAIVCTAASNVTGLRLPLGILSDIKKRFGLKLIIDGAQSAGHEKINLGNLSFDAFCFPAHKSMLGIMGTGVCIFGDNHIPRSLIEGGSGTSSKDLHMPSLLPETVEAGTLGLPGIVALAEGVRFLEGYGIDNVERRLDLMTDLLHDRISSIRGARIIGAEGGVVSFLLRDMGSERTADLLDERCICVRSGLHCSPLAHTTLGTIETGATRASLSIFNTEREIDRFYKVLKEI